MLNALRLIPCLPFIAAAGAHAACFAPVGDAHDAISATPLRFVPCEEGSAFQFAAQGLDYGLFVDAPHATLVLRGQRASDSDPVTLRFTLKNTSPHVVSWPEDPQVGVTNVYRGADASSWRIGLANFGSVRCPDVYPGIDLVYYGRLGELEYDFVVAAGADASAIAFELAGSECVHLDEDGNLVARTAAGDLVQRAPIAWQDVGGVRTSVAAAYELENGIVRFQIGEHDASLPLVIDPVVTFSTFLGGSGADQAWDFDVDPAGNICIAGYTASANFPHTSPGSLNGFWDMYVARFDPTGTTLLYSTLLGASGSGTSVTEYATGVACDSLGHAYVTGRTNATDFPMVNARQPQNAGNTDAVVLQLDTLGQIVFSTYHGGSGNENGRYDSTARCGKIALDSEGFIYVTGSSSSADFPLANALDPVVSGSSCAGGCPDMFLTKLTPDGQTLVFSTFLGDALPEEPVDIVVDAQRDIYVGGNDGSIRVHLVASDGQSLRWSRSITNGPDGGHSQMVAFDVDASGQVVLTGITTSGAYPTTAGSWQPSYAGCFSGTCDEAFVTVLASGGGPILASTYVGAPTYNEAGTAIRFDHNGDVVLGLRSMRDSGPWYGEIWKFDPTLSQRLAQVPMCGRGQATALHVDASNNVRVVGWVWNGSSPVSTPGAFQPTHAGNIDVFLSAYDMQSPPPSTPFQPVCVGDGSGTACPCGNASPVGSAAGCLSSLGLGGKLTTTGLASLANDTLVLHGAQMPNSSALYFQGNSSAAGGAGVAFGDGLRCATGSIVRLGTRTNQLGISRHPESGGPPISASAGVTSAGPRVYQTWYRNAATFCTSSTFNLTNGVEIDWQP